MCRFKDEEGEASTCVFVGFGRMWLERGMYVSKMPTCC